MEMKLVDWLVSVYYGLSPVFALVLLFSESYYWFRVAEARFLD